MRLQQYLNEDGLYTTGNKQKDDFIQLIKKDCKTFLKEFTKPVYRGMRLSDELGYGKRSPRTDRKPLDTSRDRQKLFDDGFESAYGWRARTEGLFCSMDRNQAWAFRNNGKVYLIFPIGEYKYLWSNSIHDLFNNKELILGNDFSRIPDLDFVTKSIKLYYNDKNIPMSNKNEIMFKCKSYYYIEEGLLYDKHYKELGLSLPPTCTQTGICT